MFLEPFGYASSGAHAATAILKMLKIFQSLIDGISHFVGRALRRVGLKRTMTLPKMMFLDDFAQIARKRLIAAGYAPDANATSEQVLQNYLNVLHRRVPPKVRTTYYAKGFSCPTVEQAGLAALIADSEAGVDLRSRQSLNLDNLDFNDAILNDWNINHFHLGMGPHPRRAGFVARSGPVLFAVVTDDGLYCINVMSHGSWTDVQLLDAVYENWPQLLARCVIHGVSIAFNPSNDEIKALRKANVNIATKRTDGTIHGAAGMGYATSGISIKVMMQYTSMARECRNMEREVNEFFRKPENANHVPAELALTEDNGELYAVDPAGSWKIQLAAGSLKLI